jgi:hypothetical protein
VYSWFFPEQFKRDLSNLLSYKFSASGVEMLKHIPLVDKK